MAGDLSDMFELLTELTGSGRAGELVDVGLFAVDVWFVSSSEMSGSGGRLLG